MSCRPVREGEYSEKDLRIDLMLLPMETIEEQRKQMQTALLREQDRMEAEKRIRDAVFLSLRALPDRYASLPSLPRKDRRHARS